MSTMQSFLDLLVIALLAPTLFQALRLQRALGALRRDRTELERLVAGFDDGTREARAGIDRLRESAEGAGRAVARQAEAALALREDLHFLMERASRVADRLEQAGRPAREPAAEPVPPRLAPPRPPLASWDSKDRGAAELDAPAARVRSQAERDLLDALRVAR